MINAKRMVSVRDNALLNMSGLSYAVTANELAVEVMRLEGVRISSVPKRIPELKRYGHIEAIERRQCRVTGENAWSFRITARGLEHLRGKGLFSGGAVAVVPRQSKPVEPKKQVVRVEKVAAPVKPHVSKSKGKAILDRLKESLAG